jgi:hypothetical protein
VTLRLLHEAKSRHSAERLFATYRDHLPEIAPRLSAVERVEKRSRTTFADGRVDQSHRWIGRPTVLPAAARAVVRPEWLQWLETTTWASLEARWAIELPFLGPAGRAWGSWSFVPEERGSRILAEGHFELVAAHLPATFLPAKPLVERMVMSLLQPLVGEAAQAVESWLEERHRATPGR